MKGLFNSKSVPTKSSNIEENPPAVGISSQEEKGKLVSAPDEGNIKINRSDGIVHDLQNVLAGIGSTFLAQSTKIVSSPGSSRLSSKSNESESNTITVVRSDGLSHDIIKVFKAESDARGDTMKINQKQPSLGKIIVDASTLESCKSKSRQPSMGMIQIDPSILPLPPASSLYFPKSVRIVHMSDTHNFLNANRSGKNDNRFLPEGDILVHTGDFTNGGTDEEFEQFNQWLGQVATPKYHYRVVCPGSRDVKQLGSDWDAIKKRLSNATHVLCHSEATILGIRFYGCPWHWGHLSNYAVRPGAPSSTSGRFDEIPEGIHVLVTHGPSHERLDRVQTYLNTDGSKSQSPLLLKSSSGSTAAAQSVQRKEEHWGSRELADNIRRVRPALHLHGHVKDARGVLAAFAHQPLTVNSAMSDRTTKVMYGCPHVVKATQIYVPEVTAATGGTNWSFELDFLD